MGEARPDLHLHVDRARLEALERDCGDTREHGGAPVPAAFDFSEAARRP
jgi:hypothetical protein